jgi:hypothetical protein
MMRVEDGSGATTALIAPFADRDAPIPAAAHPQEHDDRRAIAGRGGDAHRLRIVASSRDMTRCRAVHRLFEECHDALLERRPEHLVIDLMPVEAADTKLAACLIAIYRAAINASIRVELRLSDAVAKVLAVCRLDRLMCGADAATPAIC